MPTIPELLAYLPELPRQQVKKGTMLLRQGSYSPHAYLVTRGCLRSFVADTAGKEHTLQFSPEGWIVSDLASFRDGHRATLSIDALENSEVVFLDRNELEQLGQMPPAVLLQQLRAMQNNVIALNKRLVGLLSATAEERYIAFTTTYPSLARRLPLKHIASYLGITPESLSRIRKKTTLG